MKNKVIKTMLAITLTATMLVGICPPAIAAVKPEKDETVYIKTDAEGAEKSVTVSDLISNIQNAEKILDISKLTGIENVKGDETFTQSGEQITWVNDGANEICYQGKTDKELPVGVSLAYELDGKKMKPEEMEGKSGHLKIEVSYTNKTNGSDYVPFLVATGLVLDGEKYTNIKVENGKKISDGDRDLIIGFGMPGLGDYLKVKKTDLLKNNNLPDSFTMEAEVKDFEKITCMSMATTEFFSDLDPDKIDSMDALKESVDELLEAADQLTDGTGELKKGIDTLFNSSGDLTSGVDQLADGGNTLADGISSLTEGAEQLKTGAGSLRDGTAQLVSGAGSLKDGTKQLKDGAKNAKTGAEQLDEGLSQVKDGVSSMQAQTAGGIQQLYQGAGSLVGGIAQAKAGADQISGGLAQAKTGADGLTEGIGQAKQGADGIRQLVAGIAGAIPATATAENVEVSAEALVDNSSMRADLEAALLAAGVEEETIQAALGCVTDQTVVVSATTSVTVPVDTTVLSGYTQQLAGTADAVASGLDELSKGAVSLNAGLGQLQEGAGSLVSALSSDGQLSSGAQTLQAGIGTLGSSLLDGTDTLLGGVSQLKDGSSALCSGLGALESGNSQVADGAASLYTGIKQADEGAAKVYNGTAAFSEGSVKLENGSRELCGGLIDLKNGSGKLIDGIEQLDDGADELDKGMNRFNDEGIRKIADLFGADTEDMIQRVQAMIDNAKGYSSFTGISEEMDGKVKFIFVTE